MSILTDFRDEARRRGLLRADEGVTLDSVFRLVRDMPWAPASDLDPATAIAEWRGTGREKHLLLAALLDGLGYETGLIAATHEFAPESAPWLPSHLLDEVRAAPVPDVQLLLRVQTNRMLEEWVTVDASWPLAAGRLGLPVNERIVPGSDHRLACDPIEVFHIPSTAAHAEFDADDENDDDAPPPIEAIVERILRDHVGDEPGAWQRRERFVASLASWLAATTEGAEDASPDVR